MSAQTAKKRRRQYSLGVNGLAGLFGSKQAAPKYASKASKEVSARREVAFRERQRRLQSRKKK